jgi:hypothetical protein
MSWTRPPGRVPAAVVAAAAALGAAVLAGAAPAAASPATTRAASASQTRTGSSTGFLRPGCAAQHPGQESCFLLYRPQAAVNAAIKAGLAGAAVSPAGLTPRQLQSAYRLPASRRSRQTVAVSIAFDTPRLAQFLAAYRSHFKLPPCTVASGCLRIVNEHGKASPLPQSGVGTGWDLEATLDVSMISAACPHCKIIVVEANGPDDASLAVTENTAARLGAGVISNSYGSRENGFALAYARSYEHPGHAVVVSSGDFGFGPANFPADLANVTAVGGTQLSRARNSRGWTERVWNQPSVSGAAASGCSAYVAKPSWQRDPHCPGRTVADVAAVATDVPIYNKDYGGWVTVAGTSIAAPLIAGVYGLAGDRAAFRPQNLYHYHWRLFDVTAGTNALFGTPSATCGNDYLCVARKGFDGPTGLGTPDGHRGLLSHPPAEPAAAPRSPSSPLATRSRYSSRLSGSGPVRCRTGTVPRTGR